MLFGGGRKKNLNFFFLKNIRIFVNKTFFFPKKKFKCSNSHERSGIGWIESKSNIRFLRFLFFELRSFFGHFVTSSPQFRWIFHDNSKNKIRRIFLLFFSFYSINCASFMKVGSKLRGWGLLVVPWDKSFKFEHFWKKNWKKNDCSKIFKHFWEKKNSKKNNPGLDFFF